MKCLAASAVLTVLLIDTVRIVSDCVLDQVEGTDVGSHIPDNFFVKAILIALLKNKCEKLLETVHTSVLLSIIIF
jgi:hypothetical protein